MGLTSKLVKVGIEPRVAEVAGDQLETLAAAGNSLATAAAITQSVVYCNSATVTTTFGLRLPSPDMAKTGHFTIFNESGTSIRIYVHDSSVMGIKGFGGVTAGGGGAYVDLADGKACDIWQLTDAIWGAFGT